MLFWPIPPVGEGLPCWTNCVLSRLVPATALRILTWSWVHVQHPPGCGRWPPTAVGLHADTVDTSSQVFNQKRVVLTANNKLVSIPATVAGWEFATIQTCHGECVILDDTSSSWSRNFLNEQTMSSCHQLNEKTMSSCHQLNEQTMSSRHQLNEQTMSSRHQPNEQ